LLWSHMSAVRPDFQAKGIGMRLKHEQRNWALAHGYDEIRWTFDPLQRGNANFNLRRLGATSSIYHVNFYGEMTDAINAGIPSDRLEACWRLSEQKPHFDDDLDAPMLLTVGDANEPVRSNTPIGNAPTYLACIPPQLRSLAPSTVLAWRLALRDVLLTAFNCGYAAVDFLPSRNAFILHKS
jgi:predicted GNAT superfamily acetyltransferase